MRLISSPTFSASEGQIHFANLDPSKFCHPCKEQRNCFRAVYRVVNGVPLCGGCVADSRVQWFGALKMLDPEKIEAIERDAASLSVTEIAKKHAVSYGTAKRYAPKAVSKKSQRAGGAKTPKTRAAKNGSRIRQIGRFDVAIRNLREERDRIDAIIAQLEAM